MINILDTCRSWRRISWRSSQ